MKGLLYDYFTYSNGEDGTVAIVESMNHVLMDKKKAKDHAHKVDCCLILAHFLD